MKNAMKSGARIYDDIYGLNYEKATFTFDEKPEQMERLKGKK
eukprot:SAG11_NODE_2371_length_3446_cov_12.195100_2_plen_42_part_00